MLLMFLSCPTWAHSYGNKKILYCIRLLCLELTMYIPSRVCWRHLRQILRQSCLRNLSSTTQDVPHVCIVGSGPAGFYTAQQILKVYLTEVHYICGPV